MKKAQITIYLTLTFSLILSVFLSAFEAARGGALKIRMENAVQTAIHSVFSEYHKELFERYGLLFIDTSYMSRSPDFHKVEGRLEEYLEYNYTMPEQEALLWARDWYGMEESNVALTNIRLATDYKGDVMKAQAIQYIKDYVDLNLLSRVQDWVETVETYQISGENLEETYDEVFAEADESWNENNLLNEEWTLTKAFPTFDLETFYLDPMLNLFLDTGVLSMSQKSFTPMNHVSYRNCLKGTDVWKTEIDEITGELYFNEYIINKMGNFSDVIPDSCLDYQAEYILYGSAQDSVNMAHMVRTLFWFRTAANFIMLLSDEDTQRVVGEVAKLGILLQIPEELTAFLLNICWAAAEGVLDVRALLDGKKVILMKEPEEFRMSLTGFSEYGKDLFSASGILKEDDEKGLLYEDYIRIFMVLLPENVKTLRCMDMMEADIRCTEGNEYFRMDACADMVSMEIGMQSSFGYFYTMERKYGYFS